MTIYWVIFKHYSERQSLHRTKNNSLSLMGLLCSSYYSKSDLYIDNHTNITISAKGMTFNQNSHTGISCYANAILYEHIVL